MSTEANIIAGKPIDVRFIRAHSTTAPETLVFAPVGTYQTTATPPPFLIAKDAHVIGQPKENETFEVEFLEVDGNPTPVRQPMVYKGQAQGGIQFDKVG